MIYFRYELSFSKKMRFSDRKCRISGKARRSVEMSVFLDRKWRVFVTWIRSEFICLEADTTGVRYTRRANHETPLTVPIVFLVLRGSSRPLRRGDANWDVYRRCIYYMCIASISRLSTTNAEKSFNRTGERSQDEWEQHSDRPSRDIQETPDFEALTRFYRMIWSISSI